MVKRINRKGQFFLIAAVIISISIVSIIGLLNLPSEFNNQDIESNKMYLINFNSFLERYNSIISDEWYGFRWDDRARITFEEGSGVSREGIFSFKIRLPNDTNPNSLRLTNEKKIIPFKVSELNNSKYEVYFQDSIEPYKVKDYFLYYSNESGFEKVWDEVNMVSYNESGNNMVYTDYYWGKVNKDGIVELGTGGENDQDLLTGDARSLIRCEAPGGSGQSYPQNCNPCETEIHLVEETPMRVTVKINGSFRKQKVHMYPKSMEVEEEIKNLPSGVCQNPNAEGEYKYQTRFNETALPNYNEEGGQSLSCGSSGVFTPGEWLEVSEEQGNSITQFFPSDYEYFRYSCEPGNWSFNSTVTDSASAGDDFVTELYPAYGEKKDEVAKIELNKTIEFQTLKDLIEEKLIPSKYHYSLSFQRGKIFESYQGEERWYNESKNRTTLCYENSFWNLPTNANIDLPSNANYNTTTLWDGKIIPYQRNGSKFIFNKEVGSRFLDVYYSGESASEKKFETDLNVTENYVENEFFRWNLSSGNFTTNGKNWFTSEEWKTCKGSNCVNGIQNLEAKGGPIRATIKGNANQVNYTFHVYSSQPIIKVRIESETTKTISSGPYWKVGGDEDSIGWCEGTKRKDLPYNFSSMLREKEYTYCSKGKEDEVGSIITSNTYRGEDSIQLNNRSMFVKLDPSYGERTYYLVVGEDGESKGIEKQLENEPRVKQNLLKFNVSSQLGRFSFQKRNFFFC